MASEARAAPGAGSCAVRLRRISDPYGANTDDKGTVFPDNTDGAKLREYLRRMRRTNPFRVNLRDGAHTYKDEPVRVIIEDPALRESGESYLIQAADCAVYLLKQDLEPSAYMKQHGGNAYFKRLRPVLCTQATAKRPDGVVFV